MNHKLNDVLQQHIDLLENLDAIKGDDYSSSVNDICNMNHMLIVLEASGAPKELMGVFTEYLFDLVSSVCIARGLTKAQVLEATCDAQRLCDQIKTHMRAAL